MIVVLDTNVLVAALVARDTPPALLYEAWKRGRFEVASSDAQLEEFARVTRYPHLKQIISVAEAGKLMNELRGLARVYLRVPRVSVSVDPGDNFLFALSRRAGADYLVTGDKSGVLAVKRFGSCRVVSARRMVEILALK